MTSATTQPARGAGGRHADGHSYGLVLFASVLLFILGCVRTRDQPRNDWTVVLRRQPARIVNGQSEGGHAGVYEIICRDCGDHPDLDYREVSPRLQRIRGPYPIAAGAAAYVEHVRRHWGSSSPLVEDE